MPLGPGRRLNDAIPSKILVKPFDGAVPPRVDKAKPEAVRVLGLEHGCGVYACGVDAASSLLPGREFRGRDYLQEIGSALRSAPALLTAAREGGAAAGKARRQS